ncbi:MAG TPA: hypothetical protein DCM10_08810 [Xanthomarina gelatinilytica]|nr:hypothetical protein [Xanthomarina gelatinilytica]
MRFLFSFLPPLLVASQDMMNFEWGTVSATGLLGWYLWYTTKVVFPNHQKQVSEMQDSFTSQFNLQREHYENIIEDVQTRQDKRHEQIVQTLEKINDSLDKD